jgi:acetyl esterase/lipase
MMATRMLGWAGLLILCGALLAAEATPPGIIKKTLVYKVIDGTSIHADLYRPEGTTIRPVVVWLHGGALIMGNRNSVPSPIQQLCRTEGFALVSFDYRLAPEVKLPAIVEDIQDAFRWLRTEGPKHHLDPSRVVVAGGSAGGYLTLLTGYRVQPRPRALVAYWGYGDVDTEWYTAPSDYYRTKVPLVAREDAYRAVGGKVLTGTEGNTTRSRYYLYLRQHGLWTKEVTGFDPRTQRQQLDPYCPVRNVTADYPPTMLIHGTEDTDVPYAQSVAMAKELERNKVAHELVTVRGAGHGLGGGDRKLVQEANAKGVAFIHQHLKAE